MITSGSGDFSCSIVIISTTYNTSSSHPCCITQLRTKSSLQSPLFKNVPKHLFYNSSCFFKAEWKWEICSSCYSCYVLCFLNKSSWQLTVWIRRHGCSSSTLCVNNKKPLLKLTDQHIFTCTGSQSWSCFLQILQGSHLSWTLQRSLCW